MIGLLIFYICICALVVIPLVKELKFFWNMNKDHKEKDDLVGKVAYTVLVCGAGLCILGIIGFGFVSAYMLGVEIGLY